MSDVISLSIDSMSSNQPGISISETEEGVVITTDEIIEIEKPGVIVRALGTIYHNPIKTIIVVGAVTAGAYFVYEKIQNGDYGEILETAEEVAEAMNSFFA